ncbi:oxalate/formate MFS antiporter [Paraburkholderia silvatlantica]|uniref:Oxalate/formate antiporter n=1 Tax=Paraburkholderia silvatlantica TaxID=321895 RepID=A0ABR6FLT9_9BURK|nr:oxalate/formate MFS antiporter [Paraburkholderia silvatlantica]MBB2928067.1 oxalate/formate antiporter [Paraburkholderia silvatlantica]PVY31033.1 oxalate/formate antiporter [Paraburkholderia silvatlantica]PXW37169.1 oxalate/formate antiporter [Paraburkholderia silvatlantica]
MNTVNTSALPGAKLVERHRWGQLALGLVCMMAISSPQYVWTLMTKPLMAKLGVGLPELQVTFSILVLLQAFFSPVQGALIDRFGPRMLISIGTALTGLSWYLASHAQGVIGLYLTYGGVGGIGTGIVYVGVVGLMVRWFPERRGFAAGIAAAGYGMGAIITTFPISASLVTRGIDGTLGLYGILIAVVGLAASQGLRMPPGESVAPHIQAETLAGTRTAPDYRPTQMLRTPLFWLMFVMMTMMATSGLMVTSQMAIFAADFGVSKVLVFGLAALPLALTIDRFTNGLTRPLFGWVSDRLGRENTMGFAFALEGIAMFLWLLTREDAMMFVLLSGVVFFGWGEIFSLFPSTLTDTFGTRNATANYGWLYISFGIGSIFGGPLAALLHQHTGSWIPVFGCAITLDITTALLALFVLKPARKRFLRRH